MEPDIFDVWDAEAISVRSVERSMGVEIDYVGGNLWVAGGCIMLHEDDHD